MLGEAGRLPRASYVGSIERSLLIATALEEARRILEAMFQPGGITRLATTAPDHPAVRQAVALDELRASGSVDRLREVELIAEVADYFLDFRLWPRSPTAEFWGFIEDGGARRRVQRNIRRAATYEDTLAEVDVWAWLRDKGLEAGLVEDEGFPDIRVDHREERTWAEVKRVQLGTKPRNVGNVVTKANRQLRRAAEDTGGVLFLRVTRAGERASLDDRIPDDVAPYIAEVRGELSGESNRSVALAVVSWVDFLIFDDGQGRALHAFRRRSVVIEHVRPRSRITLPAEALDIGGSFLIRLGYPTLPEGIEVPSLPEVRAGDVVVTPAFRQINEFTYGIRPQHAIEAIAAPDMAEHIGGVLLVLRSVPAAGYSLLLLAREESSETHVMLGFRIFPVDGEDDHLLSPTGALERLLRESGVPTRLGGRVALLHPEAVVEEFKLEAVDGPARGTMHAAVRRREDGRFAVACAFAIDQERYEHTLLARR